MRILLADDERLVRLGLQSMLEELYPHQHTYLHARNGCEVVQLMSQAPDLAFLDVKMPLMNGLEALEQCRGLCPDTSWVILSGYADFEYACRALSLSAIEYILKPINLPALERVCTKVLQNRARLELQSKTCFAHDVIRSFNMADQFGADETEFLPSTGGEYLLFQLTILPMDHPAQHRIKQIICSGINAYFAEAAAAPYALFFNNDGALCLVCAARSPAPLRVLFDGLSGKTGPNAFSAFYGSANTIRELYQISQRIAQISGIGLFIPSTAPRAVNTVEAQPQCAPLLALHTALEDCLNSWVAKNPATYRQKLLFYGDNPNLQAAFALIDRTFFYAWLQTVLPCTFTAERFFDFVRQAAACADVLATATEGSGSEITRIQDFVYQNYAKDVSIARVSECFDLSPSYLSKLFHEKTGKKYIDFITEVKMEQAKKLLHTHPDITVKAAAEAVGYISVRYFSKIFQKYTGLLPSAYTAALAEPAGPMAAETE